MTYAPAKLAARALIDFHDNDESDFDKPVATWADGPALPAGETDPRAIDFDLDDKLCLIGQSTARLYRRDGSAWNAGKPLPTDATDVHGLAMHPVTGLAHIVCDATNLIYVEDGAGWSTTTYVLPSGVSDPSGLAFDQNLKLAVLDRSDRRVYRTKRKIEDESDLPTSTSDWDSASDKYVRAPASNVAEHLSGLAFDTYFGNLRMGESGAGRVFTYTDDWDEGAPISNLDDDPQDEITWLVDIAYDKRNNLTALSGYRPALTAPTYSHQQAHGYLPQISRPQGLATWGSLNLVVTRQTDEVWTFLANGRRNDSYTIPASVLRSANASIDPTGLTTDGTTLWVSDSNADAVWAFTLATQARDSAKDIPASVLRSANASIDPTGLTTDGTTLWVSDSNADAVWAFTLATQARDSAKDIPASVLRSANASIDPTGLTTDGTTLWVSDSNADAVWAFTLATQARDSTRDVPESTFIGIINDAHVRGLGYRNGKLLILDDGSQDLARVMYITYIDLPYIAIPATGLFQRSESFPVAYRYKGQSGVVDATAPEYISVDDRRHDLRIRHGLKPPTADAWWRSVSADGRLELEDYDGRFTPTSTDNGLGFNGVLDVAVVGTATDEVYQRTLDVDDETNTWTWGDWDAGVEAPSDSGGTKETEPTGIGAAPDGTLALVGTVTDKFFLKSPGEDWDSGINGPAAATEMTGLGFATNGDVLVVDKRLITTTLSAAATASATSITVAAAIGLAANDVIVIGAEQLEITAISSNTLTVARGVNETTAAAHASGDTVTRNDSAVHRWNHTALAGLNHRGAWDADADYELFDAVTSGDKYWGCKLPISGDASNPAPATGSTHWDEITNVWNEGDDSPLALPVELTDPQGVGEATNGDIAVLDGLSKGVHIHIAQQGAGAGDWDPNPHLLTGVTDATDNTRAPFDLVNPQGVSFDPDGHLYVVDDNGASSKIHVFAVGGAQLSETPIPASEVDPRGIAVRNNNRKAHVLSKRHKCIIELGYERYVDGQLVFTGYPFWRGWVEPVKHDRGFVKNRAVFDLFGSRRDRDRERKELVFNNATVSDLLALDGIIENTPMPGKGLQVVGHNEGEQTLTQFHADVGAFIGGIVGESRTGALIAASFAGADAVDVDVTLNADQEHEDRVNFSAEQSRIFLNPDLVYNLAYIVGFELTTPIARDLGSRTLSFDFASGEYVKGFLAEPPEGFRIVSALTPLVSSTQVIREGETGWWNRYSGAGVTFEHFWYQSDNQQLFDSLSDTSITGLSYSPSLPPPGSAAWVYRTLWNGPSLPKVISPQSKYSNRFFTGTTAELRDGKLSIQVPCSARTTGFFGSGRPQYNHGSGADWIPNQELEVTVTPRAMVAQRLGGTFVEYDNALSRANAGRREFRLPQWYNELSTPIATDFLDSMREAVWYAHLVLTPTQDQGKIRALAELDIGQPFRLHTAQTEQPNRANPDQTDVKMITCQRELIAPFGKNVEVRLTGQQVGTDDEFETMIWDDDVFGYWDEFAWAAGERPGSG